MEKNLKNKLDVETKLKIVEVDKQKTDCPPDPDKEVVDGRQAYFGGSKKPGMKYHDEPEKRVNFHFPDVQFFNLFTIENKSWY